MVNRIAASSLFCVLASLMGCIVAAPARPRWDCVSDLDCDAGFACVALANAETVCARRCTSEEGCDEGRCLTLTRGDAPTVAVCVNDCQVTADGEEITPCPQGFSCARLGYPASGSSSAAGLCVPNLTCQSNADCGASGQCTSGLARQTRNIPNMLCLSAPDALGQCPMASVAVSINEGTSCLPTCSQTTCPPAMTCYVSRGRGFGLRAEQSACYLGFYGAPCETQADCFVGQCIALAGRQQCTEPCDAPAVRSDCSSLGTLAGPYGIHLAFACRADETGRSMCVGEGGVGHLCRDALDCRADLACGSSGYCTRSCMDDRDCTVLGVPALSNGWCNDGMCEPSLPDGTLCTRDRECASDVCSSSIGFDRVCIQPRPDGSLCDRDVDCRSRVCEPGIPRLCRGS